MLKNVINYKNIFYPSYQPVVFSVNRVLPTVLTVCGLYNINRMWCNKIWNKTVLILLDYDHYVDCSSVWMSKALSASAAAVFWVLWCYCKRQHKSYHHVFKVKVIKMFFIFLIVLSHYMIKNCLFLSLLKILDVYNQLCQYNLIT